VSSQPTAAPRTHIESRASFAYRLIEDFSLLILSSSDEPPMMHWQRRVASAALHGPPFPNGCGQAAFRVWTNFEVNKAFKSLVSFD
jgi:hypothetical protein